MSPSLQAPAPVRLQPIETLRPHGNNARTHSKRQIKAIARSIEAFGFLCPNLINEEGLVLAGHARLEAARLLNMGRVPTISVGHLSDAQQRAYMLADNRLAEKAGWNREQLAAEFNDLIVLLPPAGLDITITGFEPADIDLILHDLDAPRPDSEDRVPAPEPPVSRQGDLWRLGRHRLLCKDARSASQIDTLMAGTTARLTFTDPPYNVPIAGHVQGRGRLTHPEFAFARGEMSASEFTSFLQTCLGNIARVSAPGAIAYICMDWRHMRELQDAGQQCFSELLNLVVWNKTSPGQGSFYRSQHELIFVFKAVEGQHVNTFGLGRTGRTRSNIWVYPGGNSFHAGRAEEQAMHPTVKPIALVADALRDCSIKGDVVLDVFGGSGTTLLAAEKLGRIARVLEFEPAYVDVTIRRWEANTALEAVHDQLGVTWSELKEMRTTEVQTTIDPETASSGSTSDASDDEVDTGWLALCGALP